MSESPHERRKADHLRIARGEDVASGPVSPGFERYRFEHVALPEISLDAVSLATVFLGKPLSSPLLISSMTGGTPEAGDINLRLAAAAQEFGLAFALGSARAVIESPSLAPTIQVRSVAPDILLMANLGAVQLNYGYGYDECMRVLDITGADALILHLNPLQEAFQPDGDTDFSGLLPKIEALARRIPVPLVAKEVGWGISGPRAVRLVDAGVTAIDVAGAGGTSWSEIERLRLDDVARQQIAMDFRDWGIPTATAIADVRLACPDVPLIGSGGITNGVDLAKALALGADIGGAALPFLRAVTESEEALRVEIRRFVDGLRIAMFCAGAPDVAALKVTPLARAEFCRRPRHE